MKSRYLFLSILVSLISTNVFGDGPPVDKKGNITEDHTVIILSEGQLEQVGKYRILTLTDRQHEFLKKICDVFPKKIWTLTPHWRSCTCEKIYGIWNKRDQVGIPHIVLNYACELGQSFSMYHNGLIEETLKLNDSSASPFWRPLVRDKSWCVTLTMDHQGNIYNSGRRIEMADIENNISRCPEYTGRWRNTIFLSPPPSIDRESDEIISTLIKQIREFASKKDIKIEIGLSH